jgi:hypothetical protein
MASQKLTNCCVAAIALAASTYLSTPHCSTIARLAFGAFCLAIDIDAFLRKHQNWTVKENLGGGTCHMASLNASFCHQNASSKVS